MMVYSRNILVTVIGGLDERVNRCTCMERLERYRQTTQDDGGDFIPAATVSFQFNEDDRKYFGNNQYLIKLGPTFGYRISDNALVQVSGVWNKDAANRPNRIDTDFFDLGIEGAWYISDMWQLRGGFKKILDYNAYESDSVYIGSSAKF